MASAIHSLSEVAYGVESTPGQIVVADSGLVVDEGIAAYSEIEERQVLEAPRGVLAEVEDILTRKASELAYTQPLTFEEFPIVLLAGLGMSTSGAGPYVHTSLPSMTDPNSLSALSFEMFLTDGSTQHEKRKFAFGQCSEFTVELAFGQAARLSANWFGRAGLALASPATPSVLTGRELIPSELFSLFIDDAYANLGTTQISSIIRSATLRVDTGVRPNYSLDGRADLDFSGLLRGMIGVELDITAEFDANVALELADWRAGTARFISLEAAGSGTSEMKLQSALAYVEPPTFAEEDGLVVGNLRLRGRYDATSGNLFNAEVTNSIAAY